MFQIILRVAHLSQRGLLKRGPESKIGEVSHFSTQYKKVREH